MSSVKNRIQQFQQNESSSDVILSMSSSSSNSNNFSKLSSTNINTNGNSLNSINHKTTLSSSTPVKSTNSIQTSNNSNNYCASTANKMSVINSTKQQPVKKTMMMINLNAPTIAEESISVNSESLTVNSSKPVPSPNRPPSLKNTQLERNIRSPTSSKNNSLENHKISNGNCSSIPKPITNMSSPLRNKLENNSTLNGGTTMDWKEKFEESEKKRLHIVSLAQKATRDYEELRRRYQELSSDKDKTDQKLKALTNQLEALRKASEGAYEDYYKLQRRYQAENTARADALNRVDEYNKENRKLKRQSAALIQHVTDSPSFDLEDLLKSNSSDQISDTENDKEIQFLRKRLQEVENKLVEVEGELERTKLAEFESQETTMLAKDSANSLKKENSDLNECVKKLREENEKMGKRVKDFESEIEILKKKQRNEKDRLNSAENELKKILAEKNVLQRQSNIFLNNSTLDLKLQDALNQISELQFMYEEQKLNYETKILEIQEKLHEKECEHETYSIEKDAKLRSLASELEVYKTKAQDSEKIVQELQNSNIQKIPPPPPPPPICNLSIPPPPPPPMLNSLNSTIGSVTLRKKDNSRSESPNLNGEEKRLNNLLPPGVPQIDDVVNQIKKGIKLRSADSRTMSRKETECNEKNISSEGFAEMRSILNNMRKIRAVD